MTNPDHQPDLPAAPGAQAGASSEPVDTSAPVSGLVASASSQPDPQPELFPEELYADGRGLLLTEEQQSRVFTAERVAKNRDRFTAILRALGEGMPLIQIARAYSVSRNTLAAIIARHSHLVEQERKLAAGRFAVLARACSENLLDRVDSLPANVIGIVMGIATDKSLLLDGRPTAISEVKRGPTADEINAYIESLPAATQVPASSGSSDTQSDEIGQDRQHIEHSRPTGAWSGAPGPAQPVQKGGLDQVPADLDGARDPAAAQGGGGGPRAQDGGA